jgi:hypothetical protein
VHCDWKSSESLQSLWSHALGFSLVYCTSKQNTFSKTFRTADQRFEEVARPLGPGKQVTIIFSPKRKYFPHWDKLEG